MSLFLNHVVTQLLYLLSYLPYFLMRLQHLFTFEALRCGTYWRAAFKRGRGLFQCNINDLHEISKLWNFLFPNNNKWPPLYDVSHFEVWCLLEGGAFQRVALILIWVSVRHLFETWRLLEEMRYLFIYLIWWWKGPYIDYVKSILSDRFYNLFAVVHWQDKSPYFVFLREFFLFYGKHFNVPE